jgi:hypothetical protein
MAAHAVADDVEAETIVEEEGVFVRLPLPPDVGESGSGPAKRCLSGLIGHCHD